MFLVFQNGFFQTLKFAKVGIFWIFTIQLSKLLIVRKIMAQPVIKPLMTDLYNDFVAVEQLSAPLLACSGMLVLEGLEDYRFLIKQATRPIITYTEAVDVHYAGNLVVPVSGVPKTQASGSISVIETEAGHAQFIAEVVAGKGGVIRNAWYYDGNITNYSRMYTLHNVVLTFENPEYDAESKGQVMTITGQMSYNYFGVYVEANTGNLTAEKGYNQNIATVQAGLNERMKNVIATTQQALGLASAGLALGSAVGQLFKRG